MDKEPVFELLRETPHRNGTTELFLNFHKGLDLDISGSADGNAHFTLRNLIPRNALISAGGIQVMQTGVML